MRAIHCLLICSLFLFFNCSNTSDDERRSTGKDLKAAIAVECSSTINFEDLNQNVYAYRADMYFGVPSVQAGGHSTEDESTDLGVNFFLDLESLESGQYVISGNYGASGTAYVFYIVDGVEYISTEDNAGTLFVDEITFDDNLEVTGLSCRFNNIQVADNTNASNTLCVNNFELVFLD